MIQSSFKCFYSSFWNFAIIYYINKTCNLFWSKRSAIIIPNKNEDIKNLKKIRDEKENKRMEHIQIKEIKIKDKLFQQFTKNYKK